MRQPLSVFLVCACVLAADRAEAQFRAADPVPGEDFVVELGLMFWQPTPELRIQTGAVAAIAEAGVDLVQEFAIEDQRFREFRAVLKPGRKHKLRFSYVPITYNAEATLQRSVTFGGQTFDVGLPAAADLTWNMWRFGYEWDFVSRERGLLGVIGELKYNTLSAELSSAVGAELTDATAPLPGIGLIGRGYLHRDVSITAEFTGFKLGDRLSDEYNAKLFDFDIYGTISLGRNVGIQGGYRSVVAAYLVDEDSGDLKLKGLYFGGLVRF
jgi:hypothetical protein